MVSLKGFSRPSPHVAILLSWMLALPGVQVPLRAQESTLEVAVLAGGNLHNETDDLRTWEVAVRVQDPMGNRVRGAAVFFQVPQGFGTFQNGSNMITVNTDDNGEARVRFRRGKAVGAFVIVATASYQNARGTVRISQSNSAKPTATIATKAAVLAGVAAAVAAGVFAATRNDRRTSVSAGPGTVTPR